MMRKVQNIDLDSTLPILAFKPSITECRLLGIVLISVFYTFNRYNDGVEGQQARNE